MSNVLNSNFASVFTTEVLSNIPSAAPYHTDNPYTLTNSNVTERPILKFVHKVQVNKSPGPNLIVIRVLKDDKSEFSKSLTMLFNQSLQTGTEP